MTRKKSAGLLFEKYGNGIVVESINYDGDKESFYKLDFAPAYIAVIIPGGMVEEYKKLAQEKGKSKYPSANEFVKETEILDKLKNSNVKIINNNWNNLDDILDCLKKGFYSAGFQALESENIRLNIEEIVPSNKTFAA